MVTEREVQEAVALCVSCLVFYVCSGRTPQAKGAIRGDLEAAAVLVARRGLGVDFIVPAVELELVARYGQENGQQLSREFADVIRGPIRAAWIGAQTTT
jgi:hypothetical protein